MRRWIVNWVRLRGAPAYPAPLLLGEDQSPPLDCGLEVSHPFRVTIEFAKCWVRDDRIVVGRPDHAWSFVRARAEVRRLGAKTVLSSPAMSATLTFRSEGPAIVALQQRGWITGDC